MQYLECLSAALHDMAITYQPAERMAVVLRAVMVELRGGPPVNDFKLYKPKSAIVPARRGSTNDAADVPLYKKRQTSRPRAGTGSKKRSMSMASNAGNVDLSIKAAAHRWDAESERSDGGFIMVTPRSDVAAWPSIAENTPSLSHGLDTPSTTALSSSGGPRNAWMGAELDASDAISSLADVHFPEMTALNDGSDMTHLDFLSLGDVGDWGREWSGNATGVGVGSDLDGFPPQQPSYGMSFGTL